MEWASTVEHYREALSRIVAMLLAIAGLEAGEIKETLPRCTRNYLTRLVRPAESALRRLIIMAARAIVLAPARKIAKREGRERDGQAGRSGAGPLPAFALLDPLKTFSFAPPRAGRPKSFPRIWTLGVTEPRPLPVEPVLLPGDPVAAMQLCRRLAVLKRALDDLDGQARRLARWRARRDFTPGRPGRLEPMRPGWPPGRRKRPIHEVDFVLRECHSLACMLERSPDTS